MTSQPDPSPSPPNPEMMERLLEALLETFQEAQPMCQAVDKFISDTARHDLDEPGRVALAVAHVATTLSQPRTASKKVVVGALVGTAAMEARRSGQAKERFVEFCGMCWDALGLATGQPDDQERQPTPPSPKDDVKRVADLFRDFVTNTATATGVRADVVVLACFNAVITLMVRGGLKPKQVKHLLGDSVEALRRQR